MILLHDQLQDERVWVRLQPMVAAYAEVRTVRLPPLHTIGASAWATHIASYARASITPGAVDLAVTVGGAGQAAAELVADGHARAALLIDPDPAPLADETARELLSEPDVGDRLTQFFMHISPHLEEFVSHGTLSEEGIQALVDATFEANEEQPQDQLDLLRQMMTEQLAASLPLDLAAQRGSPSGQPDWVTQLTPVAGRCTIAICTAHRVYSRLDFEAALRRRVPEVAIIRLAAPASSILWRPDEVSDLVHDLLHG